METLERRYDIDWIRVIAIGLLLIYHITITFQPWAPLLMFMKSSEPIEALWIPMSVINVWRIPLLFFVSGMGVCFAIRRRDWKALIKERSLRILLPFLFGMVAIVPLQIYVWQDYYNQILSYIPMPYHLWFLGNIFIYVVILSPLFFWLKKMDGTEISGKIKRFFGSPLGLLIVLALLIVEVMVINPLNFEIYAMNWHGFFLGIICFWAGFMFVYAGKGFTNMIKKYALAFLSMGIALFLVRYFVYELVAPYYLVALESFLWVLAVFGLGYRFLNSDSKTLSYLSQAAYPVYILHMVYLNLACSLIFGLDIAIELQYVLVVLGTFVGCFATYELIRRVNFLRPLFGLRLVKKESKKLAVA